MWMYKNCDVELNNWYYQEYSEIMLGTGCFIYNNVYERECASKHESKTRTPFAAESLGSIRLFSCSYYISDVYIFRSFDHYFFSLLAGRLVGCLVGLKTALHKDSLTFVCAHLKVKFFIISFNLVQFTSPFSHIRSIFNIYK